MFSDLLKKYRKKANITQDELGIRVSQIVGYKITGNNIRSYESGTNPKLEVVESLALVLGIPVQFLFDDSEYALSQFSNNGIIENIKKVPLLDGYVGAGSSGVLDNLDITDYLYIDINSIKRAYKDKDIHALTVLGDSMTPFVDNLDIVLFTKIKQGQYSLTDGKYIIQTINGIMVKNLSFKTNGDIVISSCNSIYPPEVINQDETQESLDIIGIVVGRYLKN